MTHRFQDRGGLRVGTLLGILLTIILSSGCRPAQLRMPDVKLRPSLTLPMPPIRPGANGKPADRLDVLAVAFRPGQDQVAAGYSDGRVRLWDVGARKVIHEFDYGHEVRAVAFSADGRKLAAAGGSYSDDPDKPGPIRIWDIASNTFELELRGRRGPVDALAWSGGAKSLIAASCFYGEQRIYVWDAATGKPVEQFSAGVGGDPSLSFTDNGRYLCVGGAARIYDVSSNKAGHFMEVPLGKVGSVTALPGIDHCYGVIPSAVEQLWPLCIVHGCGRASELWSGTLAGTGKRKSWFLPAQLDGSPRIASNETANLLAISEPTGRSAVLIWNARSDSIAAALIAESDSRLSDARFDEHATRAVAADRAHGAVCLWDLTAINRSGDAASNPLVK